VLGFVGPNGAGNTTAMRIVLGVLEPDAGEVRWRGRPVGGDARRRFGYMPEERGLYPKMRVDRQLRCHAQLQGLEAAAAAASADRWIERLGLGGRAADRVEELSLGNQQRVQLATALVHDPELLVLDEPFAGLDPIGIDLMSQVLFERAQQGAAVVFSSHQLELVELMRCAVAIVKDGRLVAAGDVDELRQRHAGRTLRVEIEGAPEGWLDRLPGVEFREGDGAALLLELDEKLDDQRVLDAARSAGRVRYFGMVRPTLADLFREAVSE
jgi:ABC-2 type transport system ATP-binding protein